MKEEEVEGRGGFRLDAEWEVDEWMFSALLYSLLLLLLKSARMEWNKGEWRVRLG